MNTLAHALLPYLLLYKYWALFSVTFVAALVVPIPPGILIMGASAMAYQGFMHFGWVLASAILGNILGDNLGYYLARKYGRAFLLRTGFRKVLESERYAKVETKLQRRPGFIIFVSRFEVFTNLAVNLICGLSKVPYKKYLFYEVIGEMAQVGLYGTIGFIFAPSWQVINIIIGRFMVALFAIGVVLMALYWKRIVRWFNIIPIP